MHNFICFVFKLHSLFIYSFIYLLRMCTHSMVHRCVVFRSQFLWVPSLISCESQESKSFPEIIRLCSRWLYLASHLVAPTPSIFKGNALIGIPFCYSRHEQIFIWNTYKLYIYIKLNIEALYKLFCWKCLMSLDTLQMCITD